MSQAAQSMRRPPNPVLIALLAELCYEANRGYCGAMGDTSQVPWDEAPEELKESCRHGVRFTIDNPDCTPADQHENWARQRREHGWVHGAVKDSVAKTHPCLVPYDELPPAQKAKDHIFRAIVKTVEKQTA